MAGCGYAAFYDEGQLGRLPALEAGHITFGIIDRPDITPRKPFAMSGLRMRRAGRARLNAPDSKSGIVARLSGVQIPRSPP